MLIYFIHNILRLNTLGVNCLIIISFLCCLKNVSKIKLKEKTKGTVLIKNNLHTEMSNRTIIKYFLFIYLFSNIESYDVTISKNVLFLFIDDLRHLAEENVYLPNIQNMVRNGVNFKRAYAQQALCAPSRNSVLTGRTPDSLHLYDFYSYWREAAGNFTTLPQLFKEHGYKTFSVGKVFHPGRSSNYSDDYPYSWSEPPYHAPSNKYKDAAVCEDQKSKKLKKNLVCPVAVSKQPNQTLPDIEIVTEAITILNHMKNNTKPFFLAVGFHKPHIPLKFPRKYLEKVPISKVQPPVFPNIPPNMPPVAWHPWTDVRSRDDIKGLHLPFPLGTMPANWTLKIRQSYYAAALYIDNLIGRLFAHVDRSNTIIVLTSDHGWSLGENGLWAKYSNFDVALRVPLIFHIPGMGAKSIGRPVELLDIFPTLAELAGFENIPKCKHREKSNLCFEGKSLVSMIHEQTNGEMYTGPKFAFSQYPRPSANPSEITDKPSLKYIKIMGYTVRTRRYRYTEWVSFNNTIFKSNWSIIYGNELYDHKFDPYESNNVCLDNNYQKLSKRLANVLRSHVDGAQV